ncbi:MAG: protein TolQ [Pseudomonadales bacterium]|nr:protein TolQ [Pseudomonadales bacterium]MDP7145268.1 protein TolQ [Pseudomonadales bacterium]MDP7358360.1 protein TolQ [Pseudomonadales bacterium]MDP7596874.1 protein TolQ [Pseudomonadales bacterium]HJN51548.1 protein TolQ [Pseudomonadales bacterium]
MAETLSIVDLILNASLVVQLVMGSLFVASMASWIMIFQRGFNLNATIRSNTEFEDEIWSGKDWGKIYLDMQARDEGIHFGMESIFAAGFKEYTRMKKQKDADPDAIMQNVQRFMRSAMSLEEERLETHLSFLATVGSTSPYVGLFGTVWGIMNAFRGLATVQQASLAIVAPGISEALVATAMGLFAAIPAVIAYNRFSAQVEIIVKRCEGFIDEFSSILHRTEYAN